MKNKYGFRLLPFVLNITLITIFIAIFNFLGCSNQNDEKLKSDIGTHIVLSPDSVEINYTVHSEGDHALVFVHGWSCDSKYWDAQVDEFKDEYKIVTIDLAGHGQSGVNREKWDMQHYGADIATVINQLCYHEIILIGHSMGGAVCIEAARQMPDKVLAIVGVDTYLDFSQRFNDEEIERFLIPFKEDFPTTTDQFVRILFGSEADTTLVNWVTEDMSSAPPQIAINSMTELLRFDAVSALKEMRLPIQARILKELRAEVI